MSFVDGGVFAPDVGNEVLLPVVIMVVFASVVGTGVFISVVEANVAVLSVDVTSLVGTTVEFSDVSLVVFVSVVDNCFVASVILVVVVVVV